MSSEKVIGKYRKLHILPVGAVKWTTGFWAQRFALVNETTLPSMRKAMHDPTNGAVFSNFYVAAGLEKGKHEGTNWSDGDCYKWMEAVIHIYGITREARLDATLDDLIAVIAKAQDPDGYICTQVQLTDKERWQNTSHHELYNMGHLMTAAVIHHRVTGKTNFLDIAVKLADYLYDVFNPRPEELTHFGWNPSNIMGLVDVYRATSNEKYLELANIFVTMRGSVPLPPVRSQQYPEFMKVSRDSDPGDQNQDRIPLREETTAVGHAVTATYLYCGATDVVAETGEEELLNALETIWEDMTKKRMYITGAVGTYHNGISKRGDRVHEAFGLEYQLPNASAYNETCANIGNAMWNWRMLGISGDAKYADVMEQVIYNSGLSPISIDGEHFCYTNPLRWHGAEHEVLSHDTPERWITHNCYCCPPQVARTIARMQNWAYSLSDEGVWINLYGSNEITAAVAGEVLQMKQETDYPWDGAVNLTMTQAPSAEFSFFLRIPSWAKKTEVYVNGEPIKVNSGQYLEIKRLWQVNDEVRLCLDMEPRLVQAHPRVEEARNQVAVMRGPLVYCLESVDLPGNVRLSDVYIPRNVKLKPKFDTKSLGGVTVLRGKLRVVQRDHGDELYRVMENVSGKNLKTRLIPYFAWNNRGETEMAVWIPVI
jgi:DUF1680 family protein